MVDDYTITIVCGSRRSPSRTRSLTDRAEQICTTQGYSVNTIDLGHRRMTLFDGREFERYDRETRSLVKDFIDANIYLIASPVYYAGISGALKNFIDLIPYEQFRGEQRIAGLLMTGRDRRHQLVLDTQLRSTLVYLGIHVASTSVFAVEDDFTDYTLTNTDIDGWIEQTIDEILKLTG